MTNEDYAAFKLIALDSIITKHGPNALFTDLAKMYTKLHKGKISRDLCSIGLRSVMEQHRGTLSYSKLIEIIEEPKESIAAYEWGDNIYPSDLVTVTGWVKNSYAHEKKATNLAETKLLEGLEYFRFDITESDIEDMTENQQKQFINESDTVQDRLDTAYDEFLAASKA